MDVTYKDFSRFDQPEILPYVFHPRKDYSDDLPEGAKEYFIPVDKGVQIEARLYLTAPDAPHILFFHGNGEIISDYDEFGLTYNRYGFSFIPVGYRGYGKSTGEPTVSAMLQDAHAAFKNIQRFLQENHRDGSLLLMGRSLGSVSAIELAAAYNDTIAALVLDSAFASTVSLLKRVGAPVSELGISEQEGLFNVNSIAHVTKPTLIIHGQRDSLIPLTEAEILMSYAAAKKRRLIVIPGADHGDIITICGEAYFQIIQDFVIGPRRKKWRDQT